jgi:DNA-binding NtrC family response regulator
MVSISESLPQLRFEITEAPRILRISRATLYQRIRGGSISVQKDGRRTFITATEIHCYVTPAQ